MRAYSIFFILNVSIVPVRVHFGGYSEPHSTCRSPPAVLLQLQHRSAARCSDAAHWTAAAGNRPLLVSLFYCIDVCSVLIISFRWSWRHTLFYSVGLFIWLRNGAAMESGFGWIRRLSPLWLETVEPFWVWDWPSTGSLADGLCPGHHGLCLWPFHPWDCTTLTVCRCRYDHKASSMACSLSNLS